VVFIDPPFAMGFVVKTCHLLEDRGWLSKHAKIYVEAEKSLILEGMPNNWQQLKNKIAGEVAYYLFERIG
jgi:16S rRNA (guanine966-N2)-methyltransferase